MSFTFDSDEALARYLQEQENRQSNDIYQADLALARQLQNESFPVIDSTSAIDLTSDNEDNNNYITTTKHSNEDDSLLLALQLQKQEEESDRLLAKQLEHTVDETILNEETPNIHQLFMYFNQTYFNQQLSSVEVKWSTKMTRCAGTCTYKGGGLGGCIIALSEPILKFRPKKDLFETLLHEMIHALLFLTQNNTDRDGHGPEFLKEAKRISEAANVKITVYHNFHDEVNHYLVHVWQCNGPCQQRPPYFGIVRRSMNRPPQKADPWYAEHQLTCGGTYTKISGPPPKEKNKKKRPSNTLDHYFDSVDEKMKKLKEF